MSVITEANPGAFILSDVPVFEEELLFNTVDNHQVGTQILAKGGRGSPTAQSPGEEVAASLEELPVPGAGPAQASQRGIDLSQLLLDLLQAGVCLHMRNSNQAGAPLLPWGLSLWGCMNPGNLNQDGQHQHKEAQRDEKQEKPGHPGQTFWHALGAASETLRVVLSTSLASKCDLLLMVLWLLGLWFVFLLLYLLFYFCDC